MSISAILRENTCGGGSLCVIVCFALFFFFLILTIRTHIYARPFQYSLPPPAPTLIFTTRSVTSGIAFLHATSNPINDELVFALNGPLFAEDNGPLFAVDDRPLSAVDDRPLFAVDDSPLFAVDDTVGG